MKKLVSLGQWAPDQAPLGAGAAMLATNCFPSPTGYRQANALAPFTDALGANCIGAASFRSSANVQYLFAGTTTRLYATSGGTWADVTINASAELYEVAANVQWEFTQYGDRVIATAYFDGSEAATAVTFPQSYVMGTDTDFTHLFTGSVTEGSDEFRAAHVATVRDFVMFGNIRYDSTPYPNRVWWTAIDNPTVFAVSASTQADYQDLPDTGWVQRIYGGETAIIVTERGIWSVRYVGAPVIFQFDLMVPGLGTSYPWAGAQQAGVVYLLTDQGFCAVSRGGEVKRIGAERVDRWFRDQFHAGDEYRVSCVADPREGRILWAFPTAAAAAGTSDRVLVYDTALDRWSVLEQTVEVLCQAGTVGSQPDDGSGYWYGTSPDSLTLSPDSDLFKGGKPQLAGMDSAHKLGVFAGAALSAKVETDEANLAEGRRALLRSVRPLVDGGAASVQVLSRSRQQDTASLGAATAVNAAGFAPVRSDARYHRIRIGTSGSFGRIQGAELEYEATGDR